MRISFRIAAAAAFSLVALMAASTISASAEANPNNRGHHYGQLKHRKVVSPSPVPVPTPHPVTQPTPAVVPVTHTTHTGNVSATPVQDTTTAPVSGVPDAIMPVAPALELNNVAGPLGQFDWLVLLILPSLLAVWLIAFVGLARGFSGVRRKVMQVQAAPA